MSTTDTLLRARCDLFIGLPLDTKIDLPFLHIPNRRSAHVHPPGAAEPGYQVLLIDAQGEHDRQPRNFMHTHVPICASAC